MRPAARQRRSGRSRPQWAQGGRAEHDCSAERHRAAPPTRAWGCSISLLNAQRARARSTAKRACKEQPAARRGRSGWLREPSRARQVAASSTARGAWGCGPNCTGELTQPSSKATVGTSLPPSAAMAAAGAAPECFKALAVVLAHPQAACVLGIAVHERNPEGLLEGLTRVSLFASRLSMAVAPATRDAKRAADLARARSWFALVCREMRSRVDAAWPAQDRARDGDLRVPAAYSAFVGAHVTRGQMSAVERAAADALEQPDEERDDPAAVAFAAFSGTRIRGQMSAVERAAGDRLLQPAHEQRDEAAVAFAAFSGTPVDGGGVSAVQRAAASALQQQLQQPQDQQDEAAVAFAAFSGTPISGQMSAVQRGAASALEQQLHSRRR
jgi:hypothetical protein